MGSLVWGQLSGDVGVGLLSGDTEWKVGCGVISVCVGGGLVC